MENSGKSEVVINPTIEFKKHYTRIYKGEKKSDSPDKTRQSLLKRMYPFISRLGNEDSILDLGAGTQILEREMFSQFGNPKCKIKTVDIAEIPPHKLLMRNNKNVEHFQANGADLPFENESFSLAMSNMALDFMPREAIVELQRVLKPNARVFLNLHHPHLLIDEDGTKGNFKSKKNEVTQDNFWKYLRENKVLFETPEQIKSVFEAAGFTVANAIAATDNRDKWWEVDLIKK